MSTVSDTSATAPKDAVPAAASAALARLARGNEEYVVTRQNTADTSPELVAQLFHEGQTPFATIICCSDSRVVPEHIFMCGLGDIFVIRVAGNVVGDLELASAVYACEHLHTPLLLVLGHTHCGAIEAAAEGTGEGEAEGAASAEAAGAEAEAEAAGALAPLVARIAQAVGEERDPYAATVLNVRAGLETLRNCDELAHLVAEGNLYITGGVYHTHSGVVDFLPEA